MSFNLSNAMIWQNNDMHSQTAKTVFSHLNGLSSVESPITQCGRAAGLVTIRSKGSTLIGINCIFSSEPLVSLKKPLSYVLGGW